MGETAEQTGVHGTFRPRSDAYMFWAFSGLASVFFILVVAILAADAFYTSPQVLWQAMNTPEIRYSFWLSITTCTLTAFLSVVVAIPAGYLLSRFEFPFKNLVDAIADIPIVLPPLVIGLSLLILFKFWPFSVAEGFFVYEIPGVVLAQFMVACAFAVRTMRATFDHIPRRQEQVALTLGASYGQAFFKVTLPQAWRGVITAWTLAWARSLGEFGPILLFAGSTRMRTEVLPTTVFLEMQSGNLEAALAVSLVMVLSALAILTIARLCGFRAFPS